MPPPRAAMGREGTASSRARCPILCRRRFLALRTPSALSGEQRSLSGSAVLASPVLAFLFVGGAHPWVRSGRLLPQAWRPATSSPLPFVPPLAIARRRAAQLVAQGGPPPASRLARRPVWPIIRAAGQAPSRLRPLSSNVRPSRSLRWCRSGSPAHNQHKGNGARLDALPVRPRLQSVHGRRARSRPVWRFCQRQLLSRSRRSVSPTSPAQALRSHRCASCNQSVHAAPQPGPSGFCGPVAAGSSFTKPQA